MCIYRQKHLFFINNLAGQVILICLITDVGNSYLIENCMTYSECYRNQPNHDTVFFTSHMSLHRWNPITLPVC